MRALLTLSGGIDRMSNFFGKIASWCILIVSLLAAADAIMSYLLVRLDVVDQWVPFLGVRWPSTGTAIMPTPSPTACCCCSR